MMTPDEFLDWLKQQRAEAEGSGGEGYKEFHIDEMIAVFVTEYDTEDSPFPEQDVTRAKKKPRVQ